MLDADGWPMMLDASSPAFDRFLDKIQMTRTCWLWNASVTTKGYGKYNYDGRQASAHTFAYELWVGPVPTGLQIDHLCRVRRCVNPAHLEAVTSRTNNLRAPGTLAAVNAAKTHCPQGHPYDEANTCVSGGRRSCRTCGRERAQAKRNTGKGYWRTDTRAVS